MGAARAGDLVPTFTPGSGGAQEPWELGGSGQSVGGGGEHPGSWPAGQEGGSDAALDGYALLLQRLRALHPV